MYGGSRKKSGVSDVAEWTSYFSELFDDADAGKREQAAAEDIARLLPQPTEEQVRAASCLNQQFTVTEIQDALDHMKRGKAAGVDGIPAEFLKFAYYEEHGEAVTVENQTEQPDGLLP
jgi:hypothetical protein